MSDPPPHAVWLPSRVACAFGLSLETTAGPASFEGHVRRSRSVLTCYHEVLTSLPTQGLSSAYAESSLDHSGIFTMLNAPTALRILILNGDLPLFPGQAEHEY